jgi:hypothetical protein
MSELNYIEISRKIARAHPPSGEGRSSANRWLKNIRHRGEGGTSMSDKKIIYPFSGFFNGFSTIFGENILNRRKRITQRVGSNTESHRHIE